MERSEIEFKVKELLKNKFKLDMEEDKELKESISFFDPRIGFMPRDLLTMFFDLQKYFNIKFEEKDILEKKFDYYKNIIDIIEEKKNL